MTSQQIHNVKKFTISNKYGKI